MIVARVLAAALLLGPAVLPAQSAAVAIDDRFHHLRSGQTREWASFPADAEGSGLTVHFEASAVGAD